MKRSLTIAFAVSEVGSQAASGDYFTALELGDAIADRFGWDIKYLVKGENWYDLEGVDIVVAMTDDYEVSIAKGHWPQIFAVAWARNWFDRWACRQWVSHYDLVLASSNTAVQFLAARLGKNVQLLRLATNPARFDASRRVAAPVYDYVFTGNYWHSTRDVMFAFCEIPSKFRGAVFGKNWEQVPALANIWRGFISYADVNRVYRCASVVIDDANHVTKCWGSANSRVFDALASGCLVITNSRSVSEEVFAGGLPNYNTSKELVLLMEHYLLDQDARQHLVAHLRELVLKNHCYYRRALEFKLYCARFMSIP